MAEVDSSKPYRTARGSDGAMVVVRDVAKVFGRTRAVDGVSFEVRAGEVLGFLGPNGAGKTTTMKIITGFLAPTRGSVLVAGKDVSTEPLYTKARIGYLPENNPLYKEMLVADYLEYIAEMRAITSNARRKRISEMVRTCGLGGVVGKYIGELSKGFRQRVGLAQAMIHDPDILILDEPTAGLDPNQVMEMRELIRKLGQEKTLILSTHNLSEVEATCNRAIIIAEGKVLKDASIVDLQKGMEARGEEGSRARYHAVLEPASSEGEDLDLEAVRQQLETLRADSVSVAGRDERAGRFLIEGAAGCDLRRDIFQLAVASDLILLELSVEEESLEDVFHQLTTN